MNILKSATVTLAVGTMLLVAGCQKETHSSAKPSAPVSPAPADNGVAALPAAEILARVQKAIAAATSFHMSGNVYQDGGYYWLDLKKSGANMLATIKDDGRTMEFLVVDGQNYIKVDQDLLTVALGPELAKKLGPKLTTTWLKPDKAWFDKMAAGCDVAEILKPAGKVTKGAARLTNQRPVIILSDAGDDYDELHVATTGEPLPQKLTLDGGGRLLFYSYGAAFPEIKAPAASQVFDMPGQTRKS